MSAGEASLRCQSAVEQSQQVVNKLNNADLQKIAKAALSQMQELLEEISSKETDLKDLPNKAHLCIKQAEHIAWLKDLAPLLEKSQSESATAPKRLAAEQKGKSSKESVSSKKPKRKSKKIEASQLNETSLKKLLEKDSSSAAML